MDRGNRAEASRGPSLVKNVTFFRILKELLDVSDCPLSLPSSLPLFFHFFLLFQELNVEKINY